MIYVKKYYSILKNYTNHNFYIYVVTTILLSLVPFFNILLIQYILNNLSFFSVNKLVLLVFLYIFILLVEYILSKLNLFSSEIMELKMGNKLAIDIMQAAEKLKLIEFEKNNYQDMIRRVLENSLGIFVSNISILINILSTIITITISFIYLAQWNILIGFSILVFPLLFYKVHTRINNKSYEINLRQTEPMKKNWYISFLLTQDESFVENKIFGFSNYLLNQYKINVKSFLDDAREQFLYNLKLSSLAEISNIIVISIILFYVLIKSKNDMLMIGSVVAITQIVFKTFSESKNLIFQFISLDKNSYYIDELINLLNYNKGSLKKNKIERININSIELKNISFCRNNKPVFDNLNLSFKKGIYFIVGKNGSGKSTLLKIISGLYTAHEGEILINNQIMDNTDELLKSETSFMFQKYKQYEYTLKENIFLGDYTRRNDEKFLKNILSSPWLNFINTSYKEKDLQLGSWFSNSTNLSGGEWQRIALARTLFKQSSIYLFDEPTSLLDSKGVKLVENELRSLAKNNIVIIVTHRKELIKENDNIIRM